MDNRYTIQDNIFNDINYFSYIVQYQGDIQAELSKYPDYYVTIINDRYAIVSVNKNKNIEINVTPPFFSTIVYVKPAEMYTLQAISPLEASQATSLQLNLPLNLTGRGVDVAIIDTGIDYLSEEFMTEQGDTRIDYIWDQTVVTPKETHTTSLPFGTVYTKAQINEAINASKQGKSAYDIVPSRDEIGHGTNMAGLIGATGKNPNLRGVVPDCNFVIVKLLVDRSYQDRFDTKVPVYNITLVMAAFEFLYRYSLSSPKPMVIYFPLGSTLGNHKGIGLLEQFIEFICLNSGITVVSGTGNQRSTGGHTSGNITAVGNVSSIDLNISPEQHFLWLEVWVDTPNIMSLDVISPSGESSGIISALINTLEVYTFIFEKTQLKVNFYVPDGITGDELIRLRFYDLQPGVWKIRLTGDLILDGTYNAWLPPEGLIVGGTSFSPSDPFGTITNPSTSNYVVSVAAYNQNNNNIANYSGMGFADDSVSKIDVAAGGVNALTVAPNNTTAVVNGTSVAAAIVAGACAMLFQWGIVDNNDPFMYSVTLKAYLERGTEKRSGDIYPNPQWGYGTLNILLMFQNMT